VVFEVDVRPLTASGAGMPGRGGDQPGADAGAPGPGGHHGIEDEGVGTAVPRHVDEACQLAILPGAYPAQAVPADPGTPVGADLAGPEALGMQRADRRVLEVTPPLISDHHLAIMGPPAEHLTRYLALAEPLPGQVHDAPLGVGVRRRGRCAGVTRPRPGCAAGQVPWPALACSIATRSAPSAVPSGSAMPSWPPGDQQGPGQAHPEAISQIRFVIRVALQPVHISGPMGASRRVL